MAANSNTFIIRHPFKKQQDEIMQLLISLAGILVLVVCAWVFSENRKAINWRTVGGALFLQASFAA